MHVTALVSWFERVTVIMWSAKLCKWICYIYCVHVWQAIQRQNQRNKQLSLWFPSRHYLSLLTLNLQVVFLKTTGHKFVIQSYNTFNNSNNNNKSLLPTYPFSPTMTLQQPTFFLLILAQTPVQHPWHLYIYPHCHDFSGWSNLQCLLLFCPVLTQSYVCPLPFLNHLFSWPYFTHMYVQCVMKWNSFVTSKLSLLK